ncbi:hypothetical protein ACVGVM_25210 [Pseudonocardia bannensis]
MIVSIHHGRGRNPTTTHLHDYQLIFANRLSGPEVTPRLLLSTHDLEEAQH